MKENLHVVSLLWLFLSHKTGITGHFHHHHSPSCSFECGIHLHAIDIWGKAPGSVWVDLHSMQNRSLAAVGWEQDLLGLWEKMTTSPWLHENVSQLYIFVWKNAAVPCG